MSFFAKITLWFFGTFVFMWAATIITTALTFTAPESRQSPLTMLMNARMEGSIHQYEEGGPDALARSLARFQHATGAQAIMTDASGKDLVSGQDRSDLLKQAGPRPRFPFTRRNRTAIARQSADGRYWLFLMLPRPPVWGFWWFGWFLRWQHLWILGIVILLCYWFAYHVTAPVRKMQHQVDCFGRGDLTARVAMNRRDELGQLARTFNQMADRIQTLLAAERRLLLDISHELRSPLARLCVAVELARSRSDDTNLDRIEKEAERLNTLVGELLQVTRAEGDPSKLKMDPVRLDEIVEEIVGDTSIEATAKGSSIEWKKPGAFEVMGDPELLRRAIENIIRNAIRYAPAGTPVEVAVRPAGATINVCVRDYGPGVPEEALPRIFDPFYRVEEDRGRASGGVGLGLAIARRAVELHKGKLRASNSHPGLLVTIELPTPVARIGGPEEVEPVARSA